MDLDPTRSPNFCPAPWTTLYLQMNGSTSPCGHYDREGSLGNINEQTPEEIWNSPASKQLRLEMLRGQRKIPNCVECRRIEGLGEHSLRQDLLRFHRDDLSFAAQTKPDGSLDGPDLTSLTITTGDHCQLRCLMCGPVWSSAWKKELNLPADSGSVGTVAQDRIKAIVDRSRRLKRILFVGGEPLISPLHYEILELLLKQRRPGQTELAYNTNLFDLKLASKDATEYWSQFPRVALYVSIDGTGEKFGAIRRGHSWSRLLENLATVRERCPHIQLYAVITLSTFNLLDVPDVTRTLLEETRFAADRILFNYVRLPHEINVQSVPASQKAEARERYVAFMREILMKYDADVAAHLLALLKVSLKYLEGKPEPAGKNSRAEGGDS